MAPGDDLNPATVCPNVLFFIYEYFDLFFFEKSYTFICNVQETSISFFPGCFLQINSSFLSEFYYLK